MSKKMPAHLTKQRIKKRHWLLGSLVILVGSWITHTTTATVYSDFGKGQIPATPQLQGAMASTPVASVGTMATAGAIGTQSKAATYTAKLNSHNTTPGQATLSAADVPFDERIYTIKRGDTLDGIFKKLDLDRSLPYLISRHETGRHLASLAIGKDLLFKTDRENQLRQIGYPFSYLQELVVDLQHGAIMGAQIRDLPYTTERKTVSVEISSSLYESALEAGLSNGMVMEMVTIFGWDIDFVLDIRRGDNFHVIYEQHNLHGEKLADGDILAAEFTTQNQTFRAIRFDDGQGGVSYYNPQGDSMLGTFLRSPVEFSRISSRFGKRKHPILKTWRAHKGVDYAASRGTPIRATADGKVIHAGNKGGYGKAVVLRHAGRFSTLYGHMKGFAKGIRSGSRVKQGDVIGYIGSTGLATGPHLHYEFRLDGVHRNPLTYKTPKASAVTAALRTEFDLLTNRSMAELNSITGAYRLAQDNHNTIGERNSTVSQPL